MALVEHNFANTDALNTAFCERIVGILKAGIEQNGRASIAVSGGRTPQALFAALSVSALDWSKVDISLVDDRWVATDDAASNDKLVREHLLVNNAAVANFVGLKTADKNAEDAVAACTEKLAAIHTPFDVLILGMGEDGHTASLFPCSAQIQQGLDLTSNAVYLAVQPTTAPHQRMSLTLAEILKSKNIFLHLTGESKKQVLNVALEGNDEAQMPIRAVLNRAEVELMWAP